MAVSAVSSASRRRASALLPDVPLRTPDEIGPDVDLLLLAVPDDALPALVEGLVNADTLHAGQFIMHTSGRYGIDVLSPATTIGTLPLALHPVMTFTGTSIDLDRLTGVCFGVTSVPVLRPVAEALVLEMGGEPVWIDEVDRVALSRGTGARREPSRDAGGLVDGPPSRGRRGEPAATPWAVAVGGTRQRVAARRCGVDRAGRPGRRGTVGAHVDAILRISPETAAAYIAMARLTADRALAAGLLPADDAAALLGVLSRRSSS